MKMRDILNLFEENQDLKNLVKQDQEDRNEYKSFVETECNGDYELGAKLYAKMKNRSPDDIFNEISTKNKFIKMTFDFDTFSKQDWENYWLLAQHCDHDREFQQRALDIIVKHLGKNNDHFRYLSDRLEMAKTGKQTFGTQNKF